MLLPALSRRSLSPVARSLRPEASHGAKHYAEGREDRVEGRPLSPLCVRVVCVLRMSCVFRGGGAWSCSRSGACLPKERSPALAPGP